MSNDSYYGLTSNGVNRTGNFTNAFGVDDEKRLELYIRKLSGKLFNIQVVIGFAGNFTSLAVLCRKAFRGSSTAVYLRTLAVVDSLILFSVRLVIIPQMHAIVCTNNLACYVYDFIVLVLTDTSVWILMLLSYERLIAILRPYDAKSLLTVKRSVKSLCLTFVILAALDTHDLWFMNRTRCIECIIVYSKRDFIFNLVTALFNSAKACYLPFPFICLSCIIVILRTRGRKLKREHRAERNHASCSRTQSAKTGQKSTRKTLRRAKYSLPSDCFMISQGNSDTSIVHNETSAGVNNAIMYHSKASDSFRGKSLTGVSQSPSKRRSLSRKQGRDRGMMITLVALNVCFIVTRLPHELHKMITLDQVDPEVFMAKYVLIFFVALNSALNIFLYVGTGSKFRSEFIALMKDIRDVCRRRN